MSKHDTEVYLRNGHVLKIHSSQVTITRSNLSGAIEQFEWRKEGGRELISIDITEICAVISVDYNRRRLLKIRNLLHRKNNKKGKK